MGRILIVEDEGVTALALSRVLADLGHEVVGSAASGEDALALARKHRPDLVVMDLQIEGTMDGIEVAQILIDQMDIPSIYLTAYSDTASLERARQTRPLGYLVKPFDIPTLKTSIEVGFVKHKHYAELYEREQWFTRTLRMVHDGVITTDLTGKVQYINLAAEQLTEWPSEEALGTDVDKVFVQSSGSPGRSDQPETIHTINSSFEYLITRSGYEVPIESSMVPIRGKNQRLLGMAIVFRETREK